MLSNNVLEEIRKRQLEDLNRANDLIFNKLLNDELLSKIPESLFVNYFLPRFLGIVKDDKWILEWVSIAGSPTSEVIVFKDGTNEVLYKVPSLLNSENLLFPGGSGQLSQVFQRYQDISNNIPIRGLQFLVEVLNSKNKELLNQVVMNESINRWMEILKRYNIVIKEEDSENNSNNNAIENYFDF